MKKTISVLVFLSGLISLNCSSTKNSSVNQSQEAIQKVSVIDLTKTESVRQYEHKKVIFSAKFVEVSSGFDIPGMEQYKITHFLVSLVSEDGKAKLPYVLVPAYNKVLPSLRSGDILQVEAVPYIASASDEDDYVYVVVTEMTKL